MRLSINEIKTVITKVLNIRFCELIQKGETLPAREITGAEARETLQIEEELHERLLKAVGHDFYPPDRIKIKHPSNYMISLLKKKQKKPEIKPGLKIKFHVVITSSIGSKAAEFNVSVDSRSEADGLALAEIRKLGLKRATYKIS